MNPSYLIKSLALESSFLTTARRGWSLRVAVILAALSLGGTASLHAQSYYTTPYTFTTFAGSPKQGGTADGAGYSARFLNPQGVAVDALGNVYVTDCYNSSIRKITPDGLVSTFAGTPGISGSADGTGTAAQFNYPYGIAVDTAGNVYVADSGNSTVRKITPGAVVTTLAGSPGSPGSKDGTGSAARFFGLFGITVDPSGNVYVTDRGNDTIRKITPAGVVTTLAGRVGVTGSSDGNGSAARFNLPTGIAIDNNGNIFVADYGNDTIRKILPGGNVTTFAGSPEVIWSTDGVGSNARFYLPCGLAVDAGNNIYVADTSNHTIRKITPSAVVSTLAGLPASTGSADGTGSAVRFNLPTGVAVDARGSVYVADFANFTIRKGVPPTPQITSSGLVTVQLGQSLAYQITATKNPISYGATGLPPGLSINNSTGFISGTPTAAGTSTVTLYATSASAGTGSFAITISVVTDPFNGVALGGGWYYSAWFGYYNALYSPWLYHNNLGFMYLNPQVAGSADLYFWVNNGNNGGNMGWIYTTPTLFPNVYSFTRNSWLYYTGSTVFYNYTTAAFENY